MPSTGTRFAQIVRYPNGTSSDPFIAHVARQEMIDFAIAAFIEGGYRSSIDDWMQRADISDDWKDSPRVSGVMGGRFWRTLEIWSNEVCCIGGVGDRPRPDGILSAAEMAPMFRWAREAGPFHTLAVGVPAHDFMPMLGRTVVAWGKTIEEWAIKDVTPE